MRVNSELAAKRKGFTQTFDNRGEEEIPGQLNHIGRVSFIADRECLLSNHVEKRLAAPDLFGWSSGHNEQLPGGSGVRPAKDGRGQIMLLLFAMGAGQPLRKFHTNGAHGNSNGAGRQRLNGITG